MAKVTLLSTVLYMYMLNHDATFYIGEPIAWCISDRKTAEVIEIFLQWIKERSPSVDVKVLMTDDGTLFILY